MKLHKYSVLFILLVFVIGLLIGVVIAPLFSQWRISNIGTVRAIGVEVYRDANLTETLDHINWGIIEPGENKSFTMWIKNTGNDAQKIVMWTEAWNPSNASNWITLTWNYDGSWIPVNGSIPVVFILSVDPLISGIISFSFEIWIKGVH